MLTYNIYVYTFSSNLNAKLDMKCEQSNVLLEFNFMYYIIHGRNRFEIGITIITRRKKISNHYVVVTPSAIRGARGVNWEENKKCCDLQNFVLSR